MNKRSKSERLFLKCIFFNFSFYLKIPSFNLMIFWFGCLMYFKD